METMETQKYLFGVDPGLMTGVCLIDITNMDDPVPIWDDEWSIEQFHTNIGRIMETPGVEVVMEDFRITTETGKLSQQPWSLHLIGVVNYLAFLHKVEVTLQLPSQKPFATNERLRSVGFWSKGTEGHSIDAFRHCMIWIVNRNRKWTKKLLV